MRNDTTTESAMNDHNGLSLFADDYSYVIARDPMDAARLNAEAFAGDPSVATERDAAEYAPVRMRAVVGVAEDERGAVVEKTAREWIAEKGRGVLAWEDC